MTMFDFFQPPDFSESFTPMKHGTVTNDVVDDEAADEGAEDEEEKKETSHERIDRLNKELLVE